MQVNCTQHIFYRTHSFTSEFRPCCFARTHSMHPQSRQVTGQTQKLEKEKSFLAFQELVLKTEELRITSSRCQSQCGTLIPWPSKYTLNQRCLLPHVCHNKGHIQNSQFQPTSQPSLIPYTLTGCSWNWLPIQSACWQQRWLQGELLEGCGNMALHTLSATSKCCWRHCHVLAFSSTNQTSYTFSCLKKSHNILTNGTFNNWQCSIIQKELLSIIPCLLICSLKKKITTWISYSKQAPADKSFSFHFCY